MRAKDIWAIDVLELAFAAELAMKQWYEITREHPNLHKGLRGPRDELAMAAQFTVDVLHGLPPGTCILYGQGALPEEDLRAVAQFIAESDMVEVPEVWPSTQTQMREGLKQTKDDYISALQ